MPGDETWHKPEQAQRGQCTEGGKIQGWSGWATHTPELAWEPGVGHGGAGHGDSWEMSVPGRQKTCAESLRRDSAWLVWGTAVMPMWRTRTQPRTEQQDVRTETILPWAKDLTFIMPGLHLICPWTGFLKLNAQPLLANGYSFIYYWLENKLVPFLWRYFLGYSEALKYMDTSDPAILILRICLNNTILGLPWQFSG